MEKIRTSVNLHKLDKDVPFYDNMEKYISTKISCLSSYRVEHDFQKEVREASAYLTKWQAPALLERANNRDADAILELAIRYLSGCGTRKQSSDGALYVLDAFTDPSCDRSRYVGDIASRELMAQAHSCAARAHYDKFLASPSELAEIQADERRFSRPETIRLGVGQSPFAYFMLAADHANESVKRGLVSPVVLLVGLKIREIGEVLGADFQETVKRAKRFRPLWRVVSRRLEEIYAEERKRQGKIDRSPNAYVCAAEGCGIQGEKKAALRACGGRCPPDLKPHYCSSECQKKDWARHKAICKPGSTGKALKIPEKDKAKALELFELGESEDGDAFDEEEVEEISTQADGNVAEDVHHGPGRIINIPAPGAPGGSIQISSNTMDPEFMRSLRDAASKMR
ncbi:hypothetical protein L226DRAFT_510963 [Lentinus tigrinus ALCF2SS1-7]|uniref:MYND-type domain-containing protein n=1 Tax=Lentinus tigrinus ALCF2SS1-6 TaxID=1328759 RepID=A0A5C2S1H3_9APHY|nr:hypothetical protein L227DRAFT_578168 [Lentinus tigrinus ALCF2SS1-6]RPD73085.1 hypothetical protein L226DRAFT_510963 [Lentinus tigrinus ALCF2SS1-7]